MRKQHKILEGFSFTQGKTLLVYAVKPHDEYIVLLTTWLYVFLVSQKGKNTQAKKIDSESAEAMFHFGQSSKFMESSAAIY